MWILTTSPLLSQPFTPFKTTIYNATNSDIISNKIYGIDQGPSGKLWIGTSKGISVFDGNNFQSISWSGYLEETRQIKVDKKGYAWISGSTGKLIPIQEERPYVSITKKGYFFIPLDVASIFIDEHETLWAGGNKKLVLFNHKINKFESIKDYESIDFNEQILGITGHNEKIFIATQKAIYVSETFNAKRTFSQIISFDQDKIENISFMALDHKKNIWVTTESSLIKYSPKYSIIKSLSINDELKKIHFKNISLVNLSDSLFVRTLEEELIFLVSESNNLAKLEADQGNYLKAAEHTKDRINLEEDLERFRINNDINSITTIIEEHKSRLSARILSGYEYYISMNTNKQNANSYSKIFSPSNSFFANSLISELSKLNAKFEQWAKEEADQNNYLIAAENRRKSLGVLSDIEKIRAESNEPLIDEIMEEYKLYLSPSLKEMHNYMKFYRWGNKINFIFVDANGTIWLGIGSFVCSYNDLTDLEEFNIYSPYTSGLPYGNHNAFFQDRKGHFWVGSDAGLLRNDNIAPFITPIPPISQSFPLSIEFSATDGELGTPPDAIKYEYKFSNEKKWNPTKNGQFEIPEALARDHIQILQLRATDSMHNSSIITVTIPQQSSQMEKNTITPSTDQEPPSVLILDKHSFQKPLNLSSLTIQVSGEDDETKTNNLTFSYKLESAGIRHQKWSEFQDTKSVKLNDLGSQSYVFSVRSKDVANNISEIDSVLFTVDLSILKPLISFVNLHYSYYDTDMNNKPALIQTAFEDTINSGFISFDLSVTDPNSKKSTFKHAILLSPTMSHWTTLKQQKSFDFQLKPGINYELNAFAENEDNVGSDTASITFFVTDYSKLPKPALFERDTSHFFVYDGILNFSMHSDKTEGTLFSYKIDNKEWSKFHHEGQLKFPYLEHGNHTIQVLAKNDHGVYPRPAVYNFSYSRRGDLPLIEITSEKKNILETDSVSIKFQAYDDQNLGDKTPSDSLRYLYRLIPRDKTWSDTMYTTSFSASNLDNGSYFFQVKALDRSNNEPVFPAEYFFTVSVIPFYQHTWFYIVLGIVSSILVGLVTLRRTKGKIYEQRYNPYVVGEAVHEEDMFFGRRQLMQDIKQSLLANSICLIGERRIGKTTILEHFEKNASQPAFSFFCTLESVKSDYFFSRIMQSLVSKVEAYWKTDGLGLIFFEKDRYNYDDLDFESDINTVLEFLSKNYHPDTYIVMCLDEIDATQGFPQDIHQSLRNVFQTYQGKIRMLAAGVSIQKGEWALPTSPWYNFFEYREILPLDRKQARSLIVQPVKGFYTFDRDAVEFILDKTDCKPFYIQSLCKRVISKILDERRQKVTYKDISTIYDNMLSFDLNREFETFWENLSIDMQKKILEIQNDNSGKLNVEHEKELKVNLYNHQHKVIIVRNKVPTLSTIFANWLQNQYLLKNEHE